MIHLVVALDLDREREALDQLEHSEGFLDFDCRIELEDT